jgi:tetratricopeptide (TPR) repeat protein
LGLCLKNIGQGKLAEGFHERALEIDLGSNEWANASVDYRNLSALHWLRGELAKGQRAASEALKLARRAKNTDYESRSLAYQAWAYFLQGDLEKASQAFLEAEALQQDQYASNMYLYSIWGIQHANYLRRKGEADYARRVTKANLGICKSMRLTDDISSCHQVLGDLFAETGQIKEARESYCQALDIARRTSNKLRLIEALLARGRWYARTMTDSEAAFSDLTEALEYARAAGYRLYEADIRVGFAWAHLVAGNKENAGKEATYAKQMSEGMGYYWGKNDADEVLIKISEK